MFENCDIPTQHPTQVGFTRYVEVEAENKDEAENEVETENEVAAKNEA